MKIWDKKKKSEFKVNVSQLFSQNCEFISHNSVDILFIHNSDLRFFKVMRNKNLNCKKQSLNCEIKCAITFIIMYIFLNRLLKISKLSNFHSS